MSSQTEERIKALEIALNNESQARDFYLQHSQRTQNSIGKMMFASIAADEDEHYNRILDLRKKLISDKKWPETIPIKVKGTEVKAVFNKMGNGWKNPQKRTRMTWRLSKSRSILKPRANCSTKNRPKRWTTPWRRNSINS